MTASDIFFDGAFARTADTTTVNPPRTTDHQPGGTGTATSTGTSTSTGACARARDIIPTEPGVCPDDRRARAELLAGWHSDACLYYQDTFCRRVTPAVQRDIAGALVAGMTCELLEAIMDEAQSAPRPSWAYCMAIVRRCDLAGIRTLEDWRRDRDEWQRRKQSNPALQYQQREYKKEDFGDDFFYDIMGEFGPKT